MTCKVELIQHHGHKGDPGVRQWYDRVGLGWNISKKVNDSSTRFGYDQATSYNAEASENCMLVGYNWHVGGLEENRGVERGDIKHFKHGYHDLQTKEGVETRSNWNDDLDGIRIQKLTKPTSSQMEYHIEVPAQTPHNYFRPQVIEDNGGKVKDENSTLFNPCPGAVSKQFNSRSGVKCIYDKSASALQTLHASTKYSNMGAMHTSLADTFCSDSNKVFESPGGQSCLERSTGQALAKQYCEVGSRIHSDTNCTKENMGEANYDTVAAAYCEANPNESFCSCYNVVENKCADDSTTGVAGCNHPSGQAYVNNRNATPIDQRDQWAGQRKCGSVCTGAGIYIPDNNQAGCKTTIQICSQTFNVDSMKNSDITATCELNASDGPSTGDSPSTPSPAQESAQTELEEAEAAVARGDPGAQERLDAAREALDAANEEAEEPPSLTDFQNNPKAYIPKSLDGLKNSKKQQIGAGVTGALILGCMMMLLLLVVGASGGGGDGPVKKRFR